MCVVYFRLPVGAFPEGDEPKFQLQRIKWLNKEAKSLNLQLVPA